MADSVLVNNILSKKSPSKQSSPALLAGTKQVLVEDREKIQVAVRKVKNGSTFFSLKYVPKSLEIAGSLLWWKLRKVLSNKQAWRYP